MVSNMEVRLIDVGINWPADFHRIRCLGHIIHLTAMAFLEAGKKMPQVDNRDRWRRLGCYGKFYNIVVWVQQNPQRAEYFRTLSTLQLIRDNITRWHLYYNMCERALEVKEALTALTMEEKELETEFLTITDWEHLANLVRFLQLFQLFTKANEGLRDAIDRMLPSLEYLLGHLERWRKGYKRNDWFGLRINAA